MMEEIDFELCLSVEKQAATSRREKRVKPSMDVDEKIILDGSGEKDGEQEQGEKTGYPRANKRTKVSASGNWREGGQMRQQHASGADSTSSSSSDTMDLDLDHDHDHDDPDQDDASVPYPHLSTSNINPTANSHTNISTTNRFTIYEDPDDRQTYSLALPHLPESWHACPSDNKENTGDDLYDDDGDGGLTPMDEFQSSEEGDETNHQHQHIQHLMNIPDYQPDDVPELRAVDMDAFRRSFTPFEFPGVNTHMNVALDMDMDMEIVNAHPSTEENVHNGDTAEIGSESDEEDILKDSFQVGMFLDAPPRRFLGQRRAQGFMGV